MKYTGRSKARQYSTNRSEQRKLSVICNRKRENRIEKPTTISNKRELSVQVGFPTETLIIPNPEVAEAKRKARETG